MLNMHLALLSFPEGPMGPPPQPARVPPGDIQKTTLPPSMPHGSMLHSIPLSTSRTKMFKSINSNTGPEQCHSSLAATWALALCDLFFNESTPFGDCLLQVCVCKASVSFFNYWSYKPSQLQLSLSLQENDSKNNVKTILLQKTILM